jgi:hypothetical protein
MPPSLINPDFHNWTFCEELIESLMASSSHAHIKGTRPQSTGCFTRHNELPQTSNLTAPSYNKKIAYNRKMSRISPNTDQQRKYPCKGCVIDRTPCTGRAEGPCRPCKTRSEDCRYKEREVPRPCEPRKKYGRASICNKRLDGVPCQSCVERVSENIYEMGLNMCKWETATGEDRCGECKRDNRVERGRSDGVQYVVCTTRGIHCDYSNGSALAERAARIYLARAKDYSTGSSSAP